MSHCPLLSCKELHGNVLVRPVSFHSYWTALTSVWVINRGFRNFVCVCVQYVRVERRGWRVRKGMSQGEIERVMSDSQSAESCLVAFYHFTGAISEP